MHTLGLQTFLVTLLAGAAIALADPCNPVTSPPGTCKPNVGLPQSSYTIDFTKATSIPSDWTISNYAQVNFGAKGAEFTVSKRFESPQLWTNFYMFYGKVEVVMQVAPGTGIVSSAVLMSDDMDEIDWEFSGNNFNQQGSGVGQNNYYGKGILGSYDRGQFFDVQSPQTQFHTYTMDWKADSLTWLVDGNVVRTLYAANADRDTHQYPQTPSKFQLGIWAGGDPGNAWGTVDWAGGYTDFTKAPFTTYVKSVTITNYNPAYSYNWTDQSGSANSIQIIRQPLVSASSSKTTALPSISSASQSKSSPTISTKSRTCSGVSPPANTQEGIVSNCTGWYIAKPGDSCLKITAAQGVSMDDFWAWNPAVNPPLCYNIWSNYAYCVKTDCDAADVQISTASSMVIPASSSIVPTSSSSSSTISSSSSTSTSQSQSSSGISTVQQAVSTSQTSPGSSACSAVAPPANTQGGIVANCAGWYIAKSGDNCGKISQAQGISMDTFMSWNPDVGPPLCYNLWLNYAYCVKTCDLPASTSTSSYGGSASTSSSSVPSSSLCPSTDGQSIMYNRSNNYTVNCSSDTTQGSFTSGRATQSYLDCMTACDGVDGCTVWTYVGGNSGLGGGICWFKTSLGRVINAGSNIISGALSTPASGGTSSTTSTSINIPQKLPSTAVSSSSATASSSTAPSSDGFCPAVNSQTVTSSKNNAYTIRCSSDTDIGSYSNVRASKSHKDCLDACDKSTGCVAFTYVGGTNGIGSGTCWLKNKKGNAISAAGSNYIAGFLESSNSSPTRLRCPESNGTTYTPPNTNAAFIIECGIDHAGGDMQMLYVSSFTDCITACATATGCVDVSMSGVACYLKNSIGRNVSSNAVSGARLIGAPSGSPLLKARAVPVTGMTGNWGATPSPPPNPPYDSYFPRGGRWLWNGHGHWDWVWN